MSKITKNPNDAAAKEYDLIIVGGGIYGAMLSLEASRRGLHSLLLERDDFGAHTSFNSLRILHGGFRYLQTLDLPRFRESVQERSWFLRTFPDLVRPLPCLMPLYGHGLHRPFVLGKALWANRLFSAVWDGGNGSHSRIPTGKLIDSAETQAIFPLVDRNGLKGAAVWYDALMVDSQRILLNVLKWASGLGAVSLNYVEARELLTTGGRVSAVRAFDREKEKIYDYTAKVVINAAGPWCREVAERFDRDQPSLFKPSLLWNVLLDREPFSDHALAVRPRRPGGMTYFIVPWNGKLFAGTGHSPWLNELSSPKPTEEQLGDFLDDLNYAIPSLELKLEKILFVFSGLLPVTKRGGTKLTKRPVIFDHGAHGGPQDFYSICGIKFTTSRQVAEKTLIKIFDSEKKMVAENGQTLDPPKDLQSRTNVSPISWQTFSTVSNCADILREIVNREGVRHLDDLIIRRTRLWENPDRAIDVAPKICKLLGWDENRSGKELADLCKAFAQRSVNLGNHGHSKRTCLDERY